MTYMYIHPWPVSHVAHIVNMPIIFFITGYTAKSPLSVPSAVAAPKQTIQKQSAASILSSITASSSSSSAPGPPQHHAPSVAIAKRPTPPPPGTPSSPRLDLGSPKEGEGPPKRVPIPSANKSFQLFKKQALEKSERVGYNVMTF